MSDSQYDRIVEAYGNPLRIFAESAILRLIDELTGDAAIRYNEVHRACYPGGGDGIDALLDFASLTEAHVEWIRQYWRTEKAKHAGLVASEFARDIAREFFSPNVEIPGD